MLLRTLISKSYRTILFPEKVFFKVCGRFRSYKLFYSNWVGGGGGGGGGSLCSDTYTLLAVDVCAVSIHVNEFLIKQYECTCHCVHVCFRHDQVGTVVYSACRYKYAYLQCCTYMYVYKQDPPTWFTSTVDWS